jgi:MFS family permease
MLVYTPDSFLLKPGVLLAASGALISCALAKGPITIGGMGFSLYWLLFGVTCVTLGYSSIQIGVLARVMHRLRPRSLQRLRRLLSYNRGMLLAGGSVFVGIVLLSILVYHYLNSEFRLFEISHPAIFGLLLIIVGFQTFCFTLLLEMAQRVAPEQKL